MTTKPSLADSITTTKWWHRVNGGYVSSHDLTVIHNPELFYTMAEFAAIDPRIVDVLENHGGVELMSGQALRNIIEFWNKDRVELLQDDEDEREKFGNHAIEYFEWFKWQEHSKTVTVRVSEYPLIRTKSGTVYPGGALPNVIYVPKVWMDEHYPKWQERYLIAQSLNLNPAALTAFIVNRDGLNSSVSIENVGFY